MSDVPHVISEAGTDDERQEAYRLFAAHIPDISENAVPATANDDMYAPVVACCRDPETGLLVGAALACRCQKAAGAVFGMRFGRRVPEWESVLDKHLELDLMAVDPSRRGRGVGSRLVEYIEAVARLRGVRLLFGNVTPGLEVEKLRRFYDRHGFTTLAEGQPLPPLLGKEWMPSHTEPPVFYFYKLLKP